MPPLHRITARRALAILAIGMAALALVECLPHSLRAEGAGAGCQIPAASGQEGLLEIVRLTETDDGAPQRIVLDRAAFEALPQDGFETTTIWTSGVQRFRGVRLAQLMECLEVRQGTLTLTAQNAYLIDIPVAELRADGALIAIERNGAPMSLRDKGPLWLVYPYDADPAYRSETVYARSIWQLDRIEIAP